MTKILFFILMLLCSSPAWGSVTVSINTANGDAVTDTYSTTSSTVTLAGTVSTDAGTVDRLVWDNIDYDTAGIASAVSGQTTFSISITLKSGANEILLTATNTGGEVGTDKITVTKTVSGPTISGVSVNDSSIRVYEKYEVAFSLDTCASTKYYLWTYDVSRPTAGFSGIPQGVTAYASIVTPTNGTKTVPAYYTTNATLSGHWTTGHYTRGATGSWKIRYTPQETGTYTVSLNAVDSCGTTSSSVGAFTASLPNADGFVVVSTDDGRYFKRSSGKPFWPIGPANVISGSGYANYANTGTVLARPWLQSYGIFHTKWSRWYRSDDAGDAGESYTASLDYTEHYPSSELSRAISAGTACAINQNVWFDPTAYVLFENSTDYLVKIRFKTTNMGTVSNGAYQYGFMLKTMQWQDYFGDPPNSRVQATCDNGYYPISSYSNLFGSTITGNRDWHTIVYKYTSRSNEEDYPYLVACVANISSGNVYIDQISIKKDLGGGSYGPELIRQPRSDMHTYVEDHAAYFVDQEIADAETNGVFLKYIIQDKKEWFPIHIDYATGAWKVATLEYDYSQGSVEYKADPTNKGKWRWIQEQWWRYIIARWGYSPAVFSWEYCNEDNPTDNYSWAGADNFAAWMRSNNPQPQMNSTSFWGNWVTSLYNYPATYGHLDFADLHFYGPHNPAYSVTNFTTLMVQLMTDWIEPDPSPAIPVIISEVGINEPGTWLENSTLTAASQAAKTSFYHNGVWLALHPEAGFMGQYWWDNHLPTNWQNVSTPFKTFVEGNDLHKGGYVDAAVSAGTGCTVYGQKNTTKRKAYLWLKNSNYYWDYVRVSGIPVAAPNGNITLTMNASTRYIVEQWSTTAGTISAYYTITSNGAGLLTIPYTGLTTDYAYKIYPADWRTAAYNNRRTGATPEHIGTSASTWGKSWATGDSATYPLAATLQYENLSTVAQVITGGGRAYIGTMGSEGSLAGKVYALNPSTGAALWTYTGAAGGFIGSLVYNDYAGGTVYGATTAGEVVALDASLGTARYTKYSTGRPGGFSSHPLIEDDTLILTGRDGYVYALNLDLTLKWEKNIAVPIQNSPAADNGIIYFVSEDIKAHSLYVSSGEYVSGWPSAQYYGGSAAGYWPVLTDDYMIFTTSQGLLRGFNQDGGPIETQLGCFEPQTEAGIETNCTNSGPGYYENPQSQSGFRTWITSTAPERQVMFTLNRSTAEQVAVNLVTYTGANGVTHPPPVVMTNGDVIVEFRAPCSWWDFWGYHNAYSAMGTLNLATGDITQIKPANLTGYRVPWGYFWIVADESSTFSMTDGLLIDAHCGSLGGYDFDTGDTFPFQSVIKDGYGGYLTHASWHRQEWNGGYRNPVSISNGIIYYVTGGRVIARYCTGDCD